MIQLTRLNGRPFVLNAEQIKTVEQTPDTMITLLTGDQLVVREDGREVIRRAIEYSRSIRGFGVDAPRSIDLSGAATAEAGENVS